MSASVTFSLDLEDHRADRSRPRRYPENTRRLLDFLDARGVRGTVFVVGEVADEEPGLVREIAARGHEIAFHSYRHRPLTGEDRGRFRAETAAGKARLEDLSGREVAGFRAPVFSLTPRTLWAVEEVRALGFRYSSSVLPVRNPLHGFPQAPGAPFRWVQGLLEIPVPTARIGPWRIPYLGGIYLRYLPARLIRRLRASAPAAQAQWTYCHPYDFDPHEPFAAIRDAPAWVSVLLWLNRRATFDKLAAVLGDDAAPPFVEQIDAGRYDDVPVFTPD